MSKTCKKNISFVSDIERFDLHLSESQGVAASGPVIPFNANSLTRRVVAFEIETVQVGVMTPAIPPTTFVGPCTRAAAVCVVVLI